MKPTDLKRLTRGAREASGDAARAVTREADARGLVDIAIGELDSPIGRLTVAVTDRGLVRVLFDDDYRDEALERMAREVSPRILASARRTDEARRELSEYFAGGRTRFDLRIDRRLIHGIAAEVLFETGRIPFGRTSTYGAIAERIGKPKAARAVGNALGSNPIPVVIPCHRVLRTGGALGGYGGGVDRKTTLLEIEGVPAPA